MVVTVSLVLLKIVLCVLLALFLLDFCLSWRLCDLFSVFFLWPKLGLSPQISKAANSDSRRETGFARRMITGFSEQSHLNTMFTV